MGRHRFHEGSKLYTCGINYSTSVEYKDAKARSAPRLFALESQPKLNKISRAARPRRKAGRPPNHSHAVGREALVEATVELFRTMAPAEVTLRGVARRCGVDPALVRYYFGDKSALLREAAAHILADLKTQSTRKVQEPKPAVDRLAQRVSDLIDLFTANPYLHPLVLEQVVNWKRKGGKSALKHMASFADIAKTLVDAGTKEGTFRPVDYRFLHLAIIGLCEIFVTMKPLVNELFGGQAGPAVTRAYRDFVVELLVDGLGSKSSSRKRRAKRAEQPH